MKNDEEIFGGIIGRPIIYGANDSCGYHNLSADTTYYSVFYDIQDVSRICMLYE